MQSVEFLESLFLLVLLWSDPTFLKFSKQTNISVSVPAITEEAKDLSLELGVSADADGWLWETF